MGERCYNPNRVKVGDRLHGSLGDVTSDIVKEIIVSEPSHRKKNGALCVRLFRFVSGLAIAECDMSERRVVWLEVTDDGE